MKIFTPSSYLTMAREPSWLSTKVRWNGGPDCGDAVSSSISANFRPPSARFEMINCRNITGNGEGTSQRDMQKKLFEKIRNFFNFIQVWLDNTNLPIPAWRDAERFILQVLDLLYGGRVNGKFGGELLKFRICRVFKKKKKKKKIREWSVGRSLFRISNREHPWQPMGTHEKNDLLNSQISPVLNPHSNSGFLAWNWLAVSNEAFRSSLFIVKVAMSMTKIPSEKKTPAHTCISAESVYANLNQTGYHGRSTPSGQEISLA